MPVRGGAELDMRRKDGVRAEAELRAMSDFNTRVRLVSVLSGS